MKPKRPRIVVFYGGESPNYDLSKETGYWMCQYIPRSKYDVAPVEITNNGNWKVPLGNLPRTGSVGRTMGMLSKAVRPLPPRKAIQRLMHKPVDAIITVVRGRGGDDGALHSVGEALRIPVVGSPHETCQNTSNKNTFARYVGDFVSTPSARTFSNKTPLEETVHEVRGQFMPPVIVKPTTQEGSYGVECVENLNELISAITRAKTSWGDVILQEKIPGMELSFTFVEDKHNKVHTLPPTVITSKKAPFYDHLSKRKPGRAALTTFSTSDDPAIRQAAYIARDLFDELGCEGVASVDMIAHDGAFHVLEVNTIPTFTELTPFKHQMKAAGLHPTVLLDHLIERRLN